MAKQYPLHITTPYGPGTVVHIWPRAWHQGAYLGQLVTVQLDQPIKQDGQLVTLIDYLMKVA